MTTPQGYTIMGGGWHFGSETLVDSRGVAESYESLLAVSPYRLATGQITYVISEDQFYYCTKISEDVVEWKLVITVRKRSFNRDLVAGIDEVILIGDHDCGQTPACWVYEVTEEAGITTYEEVFIDVKNSEGNFTFHSKSNLKVLIIIRKIDG
jgi:hypothetical protein